MSLGNIKNIIISVSILLLTSGCTPNMGNVHTVIKQKSDSTAKISMIRNFNFVAGGIRAYPTVNDQIISGLNITDYSQFYLEEGKYTFDLMFTDGLGGWIKGNSIEKYIKANQDYYFLVTPTILFLLEIEEISKQNGEERISSSTFIHPGAISDTMNSNNINSEIFEPEW